MAFCLRGAIGKVGFAFPVKDQLYTPNKYVNVVAGFNSIKRHIFDANPDHHFDTFLQCWNTDMQEVLCDLYRPRKWSFENNAVYNDEILRKTYYNIDFGGVSQALAIKKSIDLIEGDYDIVIVYRPDVLLWKDMVLSGYDTEKIYVNAHPDAQGDFHFVMNRGNAEGFKKLYDSVDLGNKHQAHFWIRNYVVKFMKKDLTIDDIEPGLHQEVLRKLYSISHLKRGVPIEVFQRYGLTVEEVRSYDTL